MNITFPLMQGRLRSPFSFPVVFAMTFFLFLLNFTPKTIAQTPYCVSKSQAPWQEWIGRVQLNTLDNTSDKARADRYVVGYSDWTDQTTTLSKGQSYPLSITPAFSWAGAQPNLFFRVWIDFNGNGTFEDTEKILEQNNGRQAVTSPVTIPTTAVIGSKRMRVSMKRDAYPTACETFAAGEVEDYSVQIVDVITPPTTNIVQNGGFEQFTTCPTAISQIHLATGWKALYDDPSANADYNNIGTGVIL